MVQLSMGSSMIRIIILMEIRFREVMDFPDQKYIGMTNPEEHIEHCRWNWQEYPQQEWVHRFLHTLEIVPRSWYTSVEL